MTPAQEREADAFARALLLPSGAVQAYVQQHPTVLQDDAALLKMAKVFGVPLGVLGQRLWEIPRT